MLPLPPFYKHKKSGLPEDLRSSIDRDLVPPHIGNRREIFFCAEAPGRDEAAEGSPLVGASGKLAKRLLRSASGLELDDYWKSNVVPFRPHDNDFQLFTYGKADFQLAYEDILQTSPPKTDLEHQALKFIAKYPIEPTPKAYLDPAFYWCLSALWQQVEYAHPNVICAFGAKALWAFTGDNKISEARGYVAEPSMDAPDFLPKILPTYHPASCFRKHANTAIILMDLYKVQYEAQFHQIKSENCQIWVMPTLTDLYNFRRKFMPTGSLISVDIETWRPQKDLRSDGFITCIGFAPQRDLALVVPFYDPTRAGDAYWGTQGEEVEAWRWCKEVLESPDYKILGQNFSYDVQWLAAAGIYVRRFAHDTAVLHHALQPELEKSLGFMGSVYTHMPRWKNLRSQTKDLLKGAKADA